MDLNTALMESITSMSEYFVAANTRTSFTDLAESTSNTLGNSSLNNINNNNNNNMGSTSPNHSVNSQLPTSQSNHHPSFSSGAMQKHQLSVPINHLGPNHMQNTNHHHNNHNTGASHDHLNNNHSENNGLSIHHSSINSCSQNPYQHNNGNQHHSLSNSTQTSIRFSQPTRTQIPIHCYIEQLDACADMLSYQSSLSDNDLFNTKNPNETTLTNLSSNSNNQQPHHHHPHLHQSKLALESVTNCNGTSLSDLDHHSNGLFNDNDPTETNDLDAVDTNLDHLDTDSPLSIQHHHQTNSSLTSNNIDTPQTSTSICDDQLDIRHKNSFYETTNSFHSCKETYVIVTSNILYIDLVRTVLLHLGYSAKDLINAKATIQIKNWKPLALDQVTEDKSATVGEVLGDISTFVTLRIRLYSSVTQVPTEWTETMIRQVVLALTQTMSQLTLAKLCNISQPLISSIVRGGKKLGRRKCAEFGQWYMNYIKSADARPSTMFCEGGGGARLVFDKTREIPKLKAWFATNTKPSDEILEEYSKILNQDALRKDRPQVSAKALKNWWKNERQKLGIRQREIRGRPKLKRID